VFILEFKNRQDEELYDIIREQAFNNTAAINVLVNIIVRSGLVSIEDFNKLVTKEAESVRKEMIDRVSQAGE
jgi:hypothetical protein